MAVENTIQPVSPLDTNDNHKQLRGKSEAESGARRRPCWGARHTVGLMTLLGIILEYMIHTILSVTIVAMVGRRSVDQQEQGDACPFPDSKNATEVLEVKQLGEFDWDEKTQGLLQGALSLGYALMSLPSGRIVEIYGGKRMFGVLLTCAMLLSLLSPFAVRTSLWLLVSVRIAQGVSLAGLRPAVNIVIVAWFPPDERASLIAIVYTGMNIGTVVCMTLAGWLCELDWLGGWPAPFYVVGAAGMLWSVLWHALVHPTPEQHPRICKEELRYIVEGGKRAKEDQRKKFPWRQFLRSPMVWVQTVTTMGEIFNYYIIATMVPTYLTNIQHFDLRNAGMVAALPFLLSCPVSVCWGLLVGCLTVSRSLTKRRIKQLSSVLGMYGPALCLVGVCLAGCSSDVVVVLLILSVCVNTCNNAGLHATYQELSPTFCATFMGFVGLSSSITGMVGPFVTGLMINHAQTLAAWRNVFITSAVIYFASCTLYLAFTPTRQQEWDSPTSPTLVSSSSPDPLQESRACQKESAEC